MKRLALPSSRGFNTWLWIFRVIFLSLAECNFNYCVAVPKALRMLGHHLKIIKVSYIITPDRRQLKTLPTIDERG